MRRSGRKGRRGGRGEKGGEWSKRVDQGQKRRRGIRRWSRVRRKGGEEARKDNREE